MLGLEILAIAGICYFIGYIRGQDKALNHMPYHVKYVKNCSSQPRKTFATREEAAKWVANFKLKHQGTRIEPDCWVDMVFQGESIFDEGDPK